MHVHCFVENNSLIKPESALIAYLFISVSFNDDLSSSVYMSSNFTFYNDK